MSRRYLKSALQLLVSAALITLVLRQLDLSQYRNLAFDIRILPGLAASALLFNASKIASAARLNIYQRHVGIQIAEIDNLKLYYAGMYLNLALPGGIGGDGYKILVLYRRGLASARVLLGVTLLDRVGGLLALDLLACVMLPWVRFPIPVPDVGLVAAAVATLVIAALVFTHRRLLKMHRGAILAVCGYGLLVQLLQVFSMAILIDGFGVPAARHSDYLLVFLASSIAATLPLSIGGLGIRELTFLLGLRALGLEPEAGVIASSAFFVISAVSALAGVGFLKQTWAGRHPG